MAYRFNGLESQVRLDQMLEDETKWLKMTEQMKVPGVVGQIGLWMFYLRKDWPGHKQKLLAAYEASETWQLIVAPIVFLALCWLGMRLCCCKAKRKSKTD